MKVFKNKTILSVVAAILVVGTTTFTSCEKDDNHKPQSFFEKSASVSIPRYSTYDEVLEIVEKATSFDTLPELLEYEKSQDRSSIGAISDKFYEAIDLEQFTGENDVMEFYSQNTDMLDTVIENGEISIIPKWDMISMRYVANENGLFIIDDYAYRLFKYCVVTAPESHLDNLISLEEEDLDNLDTTIFSFAINPYNIAINHGQCASKWVYDEIVRDDDIRFYLRLSNEYPTFLGIRFPVISTKVYARNEIKRFGCWWSTKRTTTINGDVTIHKMAGNGNWTNTTYNINVTQRCGSITRTLHSEITLFSGLTPDTYHFYSFNLQGGNLNIPPITLSHNQ